MRRPFLYGSMILAAFLIAGCLFDSDDKDDVKKGSISGKVIMIVTGKPVAGVKVMLLDQSSKIYSVNTEHNRTAFVDSAVTGADGSYVIDGVKPGNYSVAPLHYVGEMSYKYS